MLSPIKFDETTIPFFSTWEESYTPVEYTGETEAGTDVVLIVRESKLTVSCGGTFLSDDVALFERFRTQGRFTLTLPTGQTHSVRMRDFVKSLKPRSEELSATDGVWTVSFSLIEY